MKVLFVASECAPFVKTGGLADVIGAVPKALAPLGVEARILMPAYPALMPLAATGETVWQSENIMGGPARLVAATAEGLSLLLLEAAHLYDRGGSIYLGPDGADWPDNDLRFAALCRVGAEIARGALAGWQPDLLNVHDWQGGLVPAYLAASDAPRPPVVMTIHNIAFQGLFSAERCAALGLPEALFHPGAMEYYGQLGFLKTGLALADRITTVSPTYAREIMEPAFGMGLEGLLQARRADLVGILNGIDLEVWDPENDNALAIPFSARKLAAKGRNRAAVLERFALSPGESAPVFCVISRLTRQKGLDLLLEAVPAIVERGARLAVLGSGDKDLEQGFAEAARTHAGAVGVQIGYDEPLAHLMQGGSDAILIPSRFEPCGLTQLYGLRYGTLPVVARTGGLADTVIDANEAALSTGVATGIQFAPVTTDALVAAIHRACDLFEDRKAWQAAQRRAMRHPVGWAASAEAYATLYADLLAKE